MASATHSSSSSGAARPLLAAFASALIPGTGQFLAGDRRTGRNLMIVNLAIIVVLVFFFHDKVSVLTAFVRPSSLALMMIANIGLLGYRIWAADDAYRTASAAAGRRTSTGAQGGVMLAAVAAMAFVLLTPHVVFGYYDLVQYSLLTSVFGENETAADTTTTTIRGSTAAGSVTASGGVTTTVAPPAADPWEGEERLNILLLGGDFGAGRTGVRTDTMITVSIDPESGDVAMFSVPRNWTQAALPEGMGVWDCDCYPELINELWIEGERYPEAFPGPGSPSENAVKGVISEFLGIPIHYYAMVNLDGFVDVVDSLGGVDIYVPEQVIDEDYPHEDGTVERIEIDAGLQHLNGHLALAYARTRHQDSDYFRMNRQRCVIEAVMEQTEPTDLILNFGSLADVIKRSVTTDIPLDALPDLVELLPDIDRDAIVSIRFIPPDYHLKYRDDGKPGRIANTDLVQEHVQLVIEDPERAVVELGLENLDDVCAEPSA
jgi:LCP family protein required for cell wall assembly